MTYQVYGPVSGHIYATFDTYMKAACFAANYDLEVRTEGIGNFTSNVATMHYLYTFKKEKLGTLLAQGDVEQLRQTQALLVVPTVIVHEADETELAGCRRSLWQRGWLFVKRHGCLR